MESQAPLAFGRFEWRPSQRLLLADRQPAALGARALDVLAALVDRRDRVVGKNELLDLVWPGLVVEENNLQVQVSALRKVLGASLIATIPGRGYRFAAEVGGAVAAPPAAAAKDGDRLLRLPGPAEPLIGREAELETLSAMLAAHRLVTVVGTGGLGKTRLAAAAARLLRARWGDGAVWLDATAVSDPSRLAPSLAQALAIPVDGPDPLLRLAAGLRPLSLLLVIDNCEQLLDAAARLVETVSAAATGVHVLVTSQAPLNVVGEQLFRLGPLAVPEGSGADAAAASAAVQLFVERARAADRGFALGPDNAAAVAEICRALDGLPLAIELAAARVRLLGVQGLRARLSERLRLLTGGARGAAPRHQTLRAALEWSHSLLGPGEQAVLRRLGIFVGGFPLELARRVAGDGDSEDDGWDVLDALGTLVDKSLVVVDPGEPPRYRLLETMRLFALEQLAAQGEAASTAERHARAVASWFDEVERERFADGGTLSNHAMIRRTGPELDNARAALGWAMRRDPAPDWELAVTLAGVAAPAFMQRGFVLEHLERLRALRPHVGAAPLVSQVRMLSRLALFSGVTSPLRDEVLELDHEIVRLARTLGARRRLLLALNGLAWSMAWSEDFDGAEAVMAEMSRLERPEDAPHFGLPRLTLQATVLSRRGDHEAAITVLRAQLALLETMPVEGLNQVIIRTNLATNLNALGRHDEAIGEVRQLLARHEVPRGFSNAGLELVFALSALGRADEARAAARDHSRHWPLAALATSSDSLAMLALALGRLDDAHRFAAVEQRLVDQSGVAAGRQSLLMREALRRGSEAAGLGEAEIARWRDEGAALDAAGILALALRLCD